MRPRFSILSLIAPLIVRAHSADLYFPSIPEDPYAFPKYRVSFLNGFSLPNTTAHRWLTEGLRGGEAEFLGRRTTPLDRENPLSSKAIEQVATSMAVGSTDSVRGEDIGPPVSPQVQESTLQLMRIGTKSSYLCLIPPPPPPPSIASNEDRAAASAARSPVSSWELLQPMSQGCLYYALGWFTYAYCHNKFVKQFREAPHAHPHPPGGRIPQEDNQWESYYLGIAPSPETVGSDLASPEQIAAANKLELARGAGQRYLVQRWEDGTPCDKTAQPRKIEVQFHCSMTTPDKILLIKETSVCNYVLVIHTPRLCGEPGFKSERASQDESVLRCRQVLSDEEYAAEQAALIPAESSTDDSKQKHMTKDPGGGVTSTTRPYVESIHPFQYEPGERPHAAVSVPPTGAEAAPAIEEALARGNGDEAAASKKTALRDSTELLRKAIKALLKADGDAKGATGVADEGEHEAVDHSGAGKTTTKSDDSQSKMGSTTAGLEGAIAELLGAEPQEIVSVQGEDGLTSYILVDNVERPDDLNRFADLLTSDEASKRLDAVKKILRETLTNGEHAAANGKERKEEDDNSQSSSDDAVPATHDEL